MYIIKILGENKNKKKTKVMQHQSIKVTKMNYISNTGMFRGAS